MKIYNQMIFDVAKIAKRSYPRLPYHNFCHGLEVWSVAKNYALLNQVSEEEKFYLESAALLHDVIFVSGAEDNEEKSAQFAQNFLPDLGYSQEQIEQVKGLILVTKWPTNPINLLEGIICDSDLDNLGGPDFFKKSIELMVEWGAQKGEDWYRKQLEFLENNHYYTNAARKLRGPGKNNNAKSIKESLEGLKC
ncbi:hypothetical protein GOV12_03635 [Candidatus Pacearchaeota archaeon]|nr:hypothetical protein [Candidatus Pacearchaeota archaeon]